MTRDEMLAKMHLNDKQLRELLKKFLAFYHSLDKDQQRVMQRSMLPLAQAARTFGPDVTVGDIEKLGREHGGVAGLCECIGADDDSIS